MKKLNSFKHGFTVVELAVIIGVLAVLFTISTLSLISIQNRTYTSSSMDTLISDLKQQQLKAMVGYTEGRANHDYYGIHFAATQYTLFHGTAFNAADLANINISYANNLQLSSIAFPSSVVIFTPVSGEVYNFTAGQNTIQLKNTASGQTQTVTINRYGTVTSVN